MTQDIDIILKGLHCCSRVNPDCDNCPFTTKEVHCRELESDAENLIKGLVERVRNYEKDLIDINNKFSEGDFANGLRLLISVVERIEYKNEQN